MCIVYVGMLVFVNNNNYESGCILQSSMTHHVVSMMTEFRRGFALKCFSFPEGLKLMVYLNMHVDYILYCVK